MTKYLDYFINNIIKSYVLILTDFQKIKYYLKILYKMFSLTSGKIEKKLKLQIH